MRDLGLRAAAFAVFVALFAGSTWAAYTYLAPEGASVAPLASSYTVAPGTAFTVPFTIVNEGAQPARVTVAVADDGGLAVDGRTSALALDAFARAGGWLTLDVPANAQPGAYRVGLEAASATGQRLGEAAVDVHVLPADAGATAGVLVPVWYVGRYPDGPVFDTNVEDVAEGAWPKAADFRPHDVYEPFGVQVGEFSNVVAGFADAVEGMAPGQTKTVVVPPELAYGNATRADEVPRTVEIERERTIDVRDLQIQRRQWENHVQSTGQGDPASYAPGDTFEIYDELNTYRARVVAMDETAVTYRFVLQEGDRYTFFAFWPNASEVVAVNDTAATLRTTPTTAPGETFTYFRPWSDLTTVREVRDDVIVLEHVVPVGHTYEASPDGVSPPATFTVTDVRDDVIVVAAPNPAPLAGRTLVFDVTVATQG